MKVIKAAWIGTVLFVVTAIAAVAYPKPTAEVPAFIVAVALFLAGCGAFVAGYARAVRRSREDLIGVSELFLLTGGVAARETRLALLGALGVQIAVAFGSAIARPYSSLAAGALVPVYGIGMAGLWASRHGKFPPRPAPEEGGRRGSGGRPAGPRVPGQAKGGRTTPEGSQPIRRQPTRPAPKTGRSRKKR